MIKVDRFISPPQSGAPVTEKNGMFTHFWMTWLIGIIDAIFLLEARFTQTSLNMVYFFGFNTTPADASMYYDDATDILYVNNNVPTGMVLPDLVANPPLRVEVYQDPFVYSLSTSIGAVTITGDVYAIPFLSNIKNGSFGISGVKHLGLHWF